MIDVYVDCVLPASGNVTVSVFPTAPIVGVGEPAAVSGLWLAPLAPNPFETSRSPLTLRYSLPSKQAVLIGVYDVRGRRVTSLFDGRMGPGEHVLTWNGRFKSGRAASAGVYVIRIAAGSEELTRKVTIIP